MTALDDVVGATGAWRKKLEAAVGPISDQAAQAWAQAGAEARDALMDAVDLNPDSSLAEILAKNVDLADAMTVPFAEAAAETKGYVTQAWDAGEKSGSSHAAAELKTLGIKPTKGTIDTGMLDALLGDLDKNATLAGDRLHDRMVAGDREGLAGAFTAITEDMSRRARYTAQTAGYAAHTRAQEASFAASAPKGVKVRKMWVTRFGPGTCPMCAALHGTVVDLGKAFPWKATLHPSWKPTKPYGGFLGGPPRHPNCRCVLVPYHALIAGEKTGASVKAMKTEALKWWNGASRAAGLTR